MSDLRPRITPSDLATHPELAVLEVLDSALGAAKFAIIAANPELAGDAHATVSADIEVLAAEHVLIAVDALQRLVASYRATITIDDNQVQRATGGDDADPF